MFFGSKFIEQFTDNGKCEDEEENEDDDKYHCNDIHKAT